MNPVVSLGALLQRVHDRQAWTRAGEQAGLQLLAPYVGGPAPELRWTTDGASPLARPLFSGEVRVLTVAMDTRSASWGPEPEALGRRFRAHAGAWRSLMALSLGFVIESRSGSQYVGRPAVGRWHVGTHAVLTGASLDELPPSRPWPSLLEEPAAVGPERAEAAMRGSALAGAAGCLLHWVSLLPDGSSSVAVRSIPQ